jgi:acyl dehydratase
VPAYDEVEVGTELAATTYPVRRADLVRYAGASGDFNVIHWNERTARAVGLPDVIAHGMFTMAELGRFVTDWAGDPGRVVSLGTRFSRPVPVPDDDTGATVTVSGKVERKDDDRRTVVLALLATTPGEDGQPVKVLSGAKATVRLA